MRTQFSGGSVCGISRPDPKPFLGSHSTAIFAKATSSLYNPQSFKGIKSLFSAFIHCNFFPSCCCQHLRVLTSRGIISPSLITSVEAVALYPMKPGSVLHRNIKISYKKRLVLTDHSSISSNGMILRWSSGLGAVFLFF